ncbi:hypothetical protein Tco_1110714 [Tanacetum coccineum]|uniref:Uncharacterized protein n=1 Tax=Tanacetum coccineum TaxID=301880 RepID=A0ABQ5IK19_9ASTR
MRDSASRREDTRSDMLLEARRGFVSDSVSSILSAANGWRSRVVDSYESTLGSYALGHKDGHLLLHGYGNAYDGVTKRGGVQKVSQYTERLVGIRMTLRHEFGHKSREMERIGGSRAEDEGESCSRHVSVNVVTLRTEQIRGVSYTRSVQSGRMCTKEGGLPRGGVRIEGRVRWTVEDGCGSGDGERWSNWYMDCGDLVMGVIQTVADLWVITDLRESSRLLSLFSEWIITYNVRDKFSRTRLVHINIYISADGWWSDKRKCCRSYLTVHLMLMWTTDREAGTYVVESVIGIWEDDTVGGWWARGERVEDASLCDEWETRRGVTYLRIGMSLTRDRAGGYTELNLYIVAERCEGDSRYRRVYRREKTVHFLMSYEWREIYTDVCGGDVTVSTLGLGRRVRVRGRGAEAEICRGITLWSKCRVLEEIIWHMRELMSQRRGVIDMICTLRQEREMTDEGWWRPPLNGSNIRNSKSDDRHLEPPQDKYQKDPFGIYNILNKQDNKEAGQDSDPSHPPGFTQEVNVGVSVNLPVHSDISPNIGGSQNVSGVNIISLKTGGSLYGCY